LIYYEGSGGTTYTNEELKSEAEQLFTRGLNISFSDSGNMNVAGVTAGYVKTYNSTNDTYFLLLIFVESNYYIDAFAAYSPSDQSQVMSIINSISVSGQMPSDGLGWLQYAIIAIVLVIVVLVVAVVLMKTGKNKTPFNSVKFFSQKLSQRTKLR
jgi:hypothetical protein